MSQHGRARERKWTWTEATTGAEEPRTYRVEFPKGGTQLCPVEGCPGRAGTRTAMRVHFCRRHVRDTVIILEEGNLPHPRCEECDMLVPWWSLNGRHKDTEMCRSGGCGRFPSSSMITVSLTCLLQKCTRIAVRVPALPGHPSTEHSCVPPFGNSTLYVLGWTTSTVQKAEWKVSIGYLFLDIM